MRHPCAAAPAPSLASTASPASHLPIHRPDRKPSFQCDGCEPVNCRGGGGGSGGGSGGGNGCCLARVAAIHASAVAAAAAASPAIASETSSSATSLRRGSVEATGVKHDDLATRPGRSLETTRSRGEHTKRIFRCFQRW
eukprot:scaffold106404_cov64-Phaeocystis_antarctica.AAC.3